MGKTGHYRYPVLYRTFNDGVPSYVNSAWVRVVILVLLLFAVIFLRHYYEAFNISLRYLYMIIITLASYWFGIRGGIMVATMSIGIFFSELIFFEDYVYRDLVLKGTVIRITAYYACGMIMGILSDRNREYKDKLNQMAYYDELTGCTNFRFILELFRRELLQCDRSGNTLIVAMIDLDNFKSVNDKYGHQAGNVLLRRFSTILLQNIRNIDIVGRYGGDEFLMVFPECDRAQVSAIFKRIKNAIDIESSSDNEEVARIFRSLQFSAGVISYNGRGKNVDDLIRMADKNLYRAKINGKRAVFFEGGKLEI